MKRTYLIVIIVIVVLALGVGGYFLINNPYKTNTNPGSTSSQGTSSQATNMVSIQNFAFNPDSITVKAGTTVTWQNNDSATHTVVIGTLASPDLAPGDSYQHTFSTAGTYQYHCSIHPTMTGTVIVQ